MDQERGEGLGEQERCLSTLHHVSIRLRLENDVTGELLECMRGRPGPGAPR